MKRPLEQPKCTYDYVIVGAGPSAMGILYGLLSPYQQSSQKKKPKFSIAVIERGQGPPHAKSTQHPSSWFTSSHQLSSSVMIIPSSPLPHSRRVLDVPTGKGLGGTTNIHACLCTPPSGDDFVSCWPTPWCDEMMESVHQVQDILQSHGALHFSSSSTISSIIQSVSHCHPNDKNNNDLLSSVEQNAILEWRETSFPSTITTIPLTVAERTSKTRPKHKKIVMERVNFHSALVDPLLKSFPHLQQHVDFLTGVQVERLLWDGNQVVGVECSSISSSTTTASLSSSSTLREKEESGFFVVRATKHVILCAGAIETPSLLMVSGIGPVETLQKDGIDVRQSLNAVGQNLMDHVMIPRAIFQTTNTTSLLLPSDGSSRSKLSVNGVSALAHIRDGANKYQLLVMDATSFSTIGPHLVAGFFRRDYNNSTNRHPVLATVANMVAHGLFCSVRFFLSLVLTYTPIYFILRYFVVVVNLVLLNPSSRGTVVVVPRRTRRRLSANDNIRDLPLRRSDVDVEVQLNYLAETRDLDVLQTGWQHANNLCQQWFPAGFELFPGSSYRGLLLGGPQTTRDKCWFYQFARDFCLPYFHWCGTCAMATEKSNNETSAQVAVVDARLRVIQVPSLCVCDASVFPSIPSGPPALTCAALGLRFGKMLLEEMELGNSKKDD